MRHTKGKWKVTADHPVLARHDIFGLDAMEANAYRDSLRALGFENICVTIDTTGDIGMTDSLRRATACINACRNIPTEVLECRTRGEISAKIIADRGNLLSACESAYDLLSAVGHRIETGNVINRLDAAIKRAKEAV